MKLNVKISLLVTLVTLCMLVVFWNRISRRDTSNRGAFRDTAEAFSLLNLCIEEYSLNDPVMAKVVLDKANPDLGDKKLQDVLRSYLTGDYTNADLFHDGWGTLIHIKVLQMTTNAQTVEVRFKLWSSGANRIDEDGNGDDIVLGPLLAILPIRHDNGVVR